MAPREEPTTGERREACCLRRHSARRREAGGLVRPCRPRGARARVGRRRSRAGPRGTDCPHPTRSRDGEWSGFRGRDEGDAGVRSCSAVGQGECSRCHARGVLTSYRCDVSRRVVADGTVSRECRTAGTPSEDSDDDGNSATRLVLCLDCLPARIPHAGSSKGPTRARRFVSPRAPSETEHWSCRASMLGRSTRSAVVPADATSIAHSRDSRNPRFGLRSSCPWRRARARTLEAASHRRPSGEALLPPSPALCTFRA